MNCSCAKTLVTDELNTFMQVFAANVSERAPVIAAMTATLIDALRAVRKVTLFGSVGSAAEAQHSKSSQQRNGKGNRGS